jgi:hypothetical protein
MAEARRAERARALLGARIITNNHNSTVECRIRNISTIGARIVVGDAVAVPEAFELEVPQKGRSYNARVVWRTANETGIAFIPDHADDAMAAPVDHEGDEVRRKVKTLEAENAALRKKITELQYRLERWSESI